MIELLYTLLTVLGISFIPFILLSSFQYTKIYFYSFHIIVWIILVSINDYKQHYLWNETEFELMHNTPYPPIKDINPIYDKKSNYLKDILFNYSNTEFSIIKSDFYSKECLENYFIKETDECPITDIIVDYTIYSNNYSDYNYIRLGNLTIYYKRDLKYGKLYRSFDLLTINESHYNESEIIIKNKTLFFNSTFNYKNIESILRLEQNKLIKPYESFKNYIGTCDFICLFLFLFSITYFLMENRKDSKWNYFKIIEHFLQFIIFILYLVRFVLFGYVKKFFKQNKDLYNNIQNYNTKKYLNKYFPSDYSIQSFPIAISISMIFYYLLFLLFPNKYSCQKKNFSNEKFYFFNGEVQKIKRIYILFFPFIIIYFICFIFDIINDNNIKKIYKNTIENWVSSPITSIEISNESEYNLGHIYTKKDKYYFNSWKNNFFNIKKNSRNNYLNIYKNNNDKKKLCGKDSFGNNLYFPENEECPINDIFIDYLNKSIKGYNTIYLNYNKYLYYTNKKINGNILIDIKIGIPSSPLQLNYEKSNDICEYLYNNIFYREKCLKYFKFNTIPFYKEIDAWNLSDLVGNKFNIEINNSNFDNITLYSLTYQGINSISISDRNTINNYKYHMDNFIPLSIIKNIFTALNLLFYAFFSIIVLKEISDNKCIYYLSITIIFLLFFHFIILISCLGTNIRYVQKFMNKINKDFERHSNNYGWTLTLIFLDILYLIYYIIIIFYYFMFGHDSLFKWNWDDFNCDFLIKKFKQNIKICNILNSIKNFCINCFKKEGERESKINYESEYKCILCLTNPSQVIISPCGHKCLCLDCYNNQDTRRGLGERCPICRNNILSYVERVYYN